MAWQNKGDLLGSNEAKDIRQNVLRFFRDTHLDDLRKKNELIAQSKSEDTNEREAAEVRKPNASATLPIVGIVVASSQVHVWLSQAELKEYKPELPQDLHRYAMLVFTCPTLSVYVESLFRCGLHIMLVPTQYQLSAHALFVW